MTIIKWKVIHWKKQSGKLWYKTANLKLNPWIILDWVYKINIKIENTIYYWIWTYLDKNEIFEAHIFDFNNDIYSKNIEINIFDKIRNNKYFQNIDELKKQISIDIKKVKNIKNYVLTFWTFDILHPWHTKYLQNAKFCWDKLVTIIATDNNVFKFKWKYPDNNSEKRITNLKKLKISDTIIVWEENSPMKFINFYKPAYICLWYDQIWFSDILEKYIKKNNLKTKVIRLLPYKEKIYKSSLIKNQM